MLLCPETISSAAFAQLKSHGLRSSDGLRRLSVQVVCMKDSTKLWLLDSSRSRLLIPLTGREGQNFSIFSFTFWWFGFMEIDFYFLALVKTNESLWLRFCLPAEATMWMFEIQSCRSVVLHVWQKYRRYFSFRSEINVGMRSKLRVLLISGAREK